MRDIAADKLAFAHAILGILRHSLQDAARRTESLPVRLTLFAAIPRIRPDDQRRAASFEHDQPRRSRLPGRESDVLRRPP